MKHRYAALILAALLIFTSIPVYAASSGEAVTALSAQISKNGRYIEIKGSFSPSDVSAYADRQLSLFAVAPGSFPGDDAAVLTNIKARDSISLQTSVPGDCRVGYVLAYEEDGAYVPVTEKAYISNPDALAKYTYDYPAVTGKKGLDVTLFADAQLLGAAHTVIRVPVNEYLTEDESKAVRFKSGGTTYLFSKDKTAYLDHLVKTYSDAGMRVYIQLLLTKRAEGQPGYLYFPDADPSASYFAINTSSKEACDALYAFVSFLAGKYTAPGDGGFCGSFILGSEVNSGRYTNSAGPMALSEYTEYYMRALRITDTAARSVYSNARVFVSVANNLNKPSYDGSADPMLDYSVMDFLSHLGRLVSSGGDIPWQLSIDPYNADRAKADFRGAEGSEYSYDARYVTMDNINIITSLLSQPAYLYGTERRRVIIGEIAYPSGSGSDDAQKAQAAAYALAYYKAAANDQIDAIIYTEQVDRVSDPLNCGLYSRADGTDETPSSQKSIYRVFKYIDTDYASVVTEPYLSYYGLVYWGEAVSGYDPASSGRTVISGYASTDAPSGGKLTRIADFNGSDLIFWPSENTHLITTEQDGEASSLYGSANSLVAELNEVPADEYRGVSATRAFDLSGASAAVLDMKLESANASGIADVMFRLTGRDENGRGAVYEGSFSVTLGAYHRLYFDLTEYMKTCTGEISRVSVWVKPHGSTENGAYKLFINGISVIGSGKKTTAGSVVKTVVIIVISLVAVAAAAYGIMYLRALINYRKKKKKIEEKRRRKQAHK